MSIKTLYRLSALEMRPLVYLNQVYYEMQLPLESEQIIQKAGKRAQQVLGMFLLSIPALLGGTLSIGTRFLATWFNPNPFMSEVADESTNAAFLERASLLKRNHLEMTGEKIKLTVLSWNVCCISGGFPYAKGGVRPWSQRLEAIALEIKKRDADVVCLQEMHDNEASWRLIEELKSTYLYFYYNIGAPYFGVNSGLFVASKYEIRNPKFVAFQSKLPRMDSAFSSKGCFSFELYLQNKKIANLFTTHLQHSENDLRPLPREKQVREEQMAQIVLEMKERIEVEADEVVSLIVGDFNVTPDEYKSSVFQDYFINPLLQVCEVDADVQQGSLEKTRFEKSSCFKPELMCSLWRGIDVKDENVIVDYALVYKAGAIEREGFFIQTEIVDAEKVLAINWEGEGSEEGTLDPRRALSDHLPLVTTLRV